MHCRVLALSLLMTTGKAPTQTDSQETASDPCGYTSSNPLSVIFVFSHAEVCSTLQEQIWRPRKPSLFCWLFTWGDICLARAAHPLSAFCPATWSS